MRAAEVHNDFNGWTIYSDGTIRFKQATQIFTWGADLEQECLKEDLMNMINLQGLEYDPRLLSEVIDEAKSVKEYFEEIQHDWENISEDCRISSLEWGVIYLIGFLQESQATKKRLFERLKVDKEKSLLFMLAELLHKPDRGPFNPLLAVLRAVEIIAVQGDAANGSPSKILPNLYKIVKELEGQHGDN